MQLTELGKELGHKGADLQAFVKEQQALLREEQKVAREERQRERTKEKEDMEAKTKLRELELEYALEMEKQQLEDKERDRLHQVDLEQMEHRRKLELMDVSKKDQAVKHEAGRAAHKGPKPPKLPTFDDSNDDMDAYLQRFIRYAQVQGWEKDLWGVHLSALLKGKALEVFARLPPEDALDFETLKDALLVRFELTEEGFRKKFRSAKPEVGETFVQFGARLQNYLMRWIELAGADKTFDGLVDLLLRDQLLFVSNTDLRIFLKERTPDNMKTMTSLADQYREARGGNILGSIFSPKNTKAKEPEEPKKESFQPKPKVNYQQRSGSRKPFVEIADRTCHLCGKRGHLARNCLKLTGACDVGEPSKDKGKDKGELSEASCCIISTPTTSSFSDAISGVRSGKAQVESTDCNLTAACGLRMPVHQGKLGSKTVSVLRDSGCSGVVVRKDLVDESLYVGRSQGCKLNDGSKIIVPVAIMELDTPFFTGKTEVMVMANPLYDVIIGNIEGAREPADPDPNWSVAAAMTRAQARKEAQGTKPLKVPERNFSKAAARRPLIVQVAHESKRRHVLSEQVWWCYFLQTQTWLVIPYISYPESGAWGGFYSACCPKRVSAKGHARCP